MIFFFSSLSFILFYICKQTSLWVYCERVNQRENVKRVRIALTNSWWGLLNKFVVSHTKEVRDCRYLRRLGCGKKAQIVDIGLSRKKSHLSPYSSWMSTEWWKSMCGFVVEGTDLTTRWVFGWRFSRVVRKYFKKYRDCLKVFSRKLFFYF